MTSRRRLGWGWAALAALGLCAWTGCNDKGESGKAQGSADVMTRCEQLGKTCGDGDKHVQKIVAECKQAAEEQVANGCADEAIAVYDCYETELCGKGEKVWALNDLRVLSDRHKKCLAERKASQACGSKSEKN